MAYLKSARDETGGVGVAELDNLQCSSKQREEKYQPCAKEPKCYLQGFLLRIPLSAAADCNVF